MNKICFIDFEASSLNKRLSFPTEIGWAFPDGRCDGRLIYPIDAWTADMKPSLDIEWPGWVKEGELVTGISRAILLNDGLPVGDVIKAFENATEGYELYADNPCWDSMWMERLYAAAGKSNVPEVKDYNRLIAPYISGAVGQATLVLAQAKATEIAPRTHRAAADALHLSATYRFLTEAG